MARRDDDALSWDGDDDPTLDVGPAASAGSNASLPEGWNAVGKGAGSLEKGESLDSAAALDKGESVDPASEALNTELGSTGAVPIPADARAKQPLGNAALIAIGVLGGIYLLYAIGWLIGGLRLQGAAQFLVSPVMYQASMWLAVIAPVIWFATVWLVTRVSALWVRFTWLTVGIVLLVPWPFMMIGAVGR